MIGESDKRIIAYLLSRLGCVHPFRLSRILALADLVMLEERGRRLTGLRYVPGPGTFYVEGLKELFESDPCFEVRRGDPERGVRGCVAYRCEPPSLGGEERSVLDRAAREAEGLDDMELNRRVLEHPLYGRLAGEG